MARKLIVAIALLGCFAAATAQVQEAHRNKALPFGTPNGLWAAFPSNAAPGTPPTGFWAVVEEKDHDIQGAGVVLVLPGAPGPVPLQATGDYLGLSYGQYPTWNATVSAFPGGQGQTTVIVVMADANTIYGYPATIAAIPNPPTAVGANAVWSRVGPALSTKDAKDPK